MLFNKIRDLIIELAHRHGIGRSALINEVDEASDLLAWSVDYNDDLEKSFKEDLQRLGDILLVYESAMSKGDLLTAKAALLHAGIQLQGIEGLFSSLTRDVKRAYLDPRFNWPEFPEGWKIPSEYGFKE